MHEDVDHPLDLADDEELLELMDRANIRSVFVGVETPNDDWERIWSINVLAHVYAARAVLPAMLDSALLGFPQPPAGTRRTSDRPSARRTSSAKRRCP